MLTAEADGQSRRSQPTAEEIERLETVMEMLAANVTRVNPVRVMESLPAYTPVMAVRSFFEAVSRSLSYRQRDLQVSVGTRHFARALWSQEVPCARALPTPGVQEPAQA